MNKKQRFLATCSVLFHGLKGAMQLVHGVWKVLSMPSPRVTIFGASRSKLDSMYAEQAHLLAHKLAQKNIAVVTGGGPGIMEAVNCGISHELKKWTMGIGIKNLPGENGINICARDTSVIVDYFWVRKWLMLDYSEGFIIFPGGFGTLDELAELLTLMQTNKLVHSPIILVDTDFWQLWMQWVHRAEKEKFLSAKERGWIIMTDDLDFIVTTLLDHHNKM
jgi:uncharacterized protein (TIGR00730 family)